MATRIFIDGAAGTTGLEILDRLEGRAEFDLILLDDERRKSIEARREALNEADIAILCLPDDAARDAVDLLDLASGTRSRNSKRTVRRVSAPMATTFATSTCPKCRCAPGWSIRSSSPLRSCPSIAA